MVEMFRLLLILAFYTGANEATEVAIGQFAEFPLPNLTSTRYEKTTFILFHPDNRELARFSKSSRQSTPNCTFIFKSPDSGIVRCPIKSRADYGVYWLTKKGEYHKYFRHRISEPDQEKHLFEKFQEVSRTVIPPSGNEPLDVGHMLSLSSVQLTKTSYNENIQFGGSQILTWVDKRLAWDKNELLTLDDIILPADMIWTPDIVQCNSVDLPYSSRYSDQKVLVYKNGTVLMKIPYNQKAACTKVEYRYFCTLVFGSWNYDEKRLKLVPEKTSAFIFSLNVLQRNRRIKASNCSHIDLFDGISNFATVLYSIHVD